MEQRPEGLNFYTQGKALVLLYDFHALRFPDMPAHHRTFRVREAKYLAPGTYHVPEELLTNRALSIVVKEQELRHQFRDMMSTQMGVQSPYEFVSQACESACRTFGAGEDLCDDTGRQLTSQEILPPQEIIQAMHEDFVRQQHLHCEPLEQFIIELSAVA